MLSTTRKTTHVRTRFNSEVVSIFGSVQTMSRLRRLFACVVCQHCFQAMPVILCRHVSKSGFRLLISVFLSTLSSPGMVPGFVCSRPWLDLVLDMLSLSLGLMKRPEFLQNGTRTSRKPPRNPRSLFKTQIPLRKPLAEPLGMAQVWFGVFLAWRGPVPCLVLWLGCACALL